MRELAYFPGCSQQGAAAEYDMSVRALCRELGIALKDVPDWTCCGASASHGVDHELADALAARNLRQAEAVAGDADCLTTACPACLANLRGAAGRMRDPEHRARVNALLDRAHQAELSAKSVLQVVYEDVGPEGLREKAVRSLGGLEVVPYYGCLLTRPAGLMDFGHEQAPTAMDELLAAVGCETRPFALKTECCGAGFGLPKKEIVLTATGRLLDAATRHMGGAKARAMVVACPLCHHNLDMRQRQVEAHTGRAYNLPVLYFSQVLALALGAPMGALGFDKHAVDPRPLLAGVLKTTGPAGTEA